MREDQIIYAGEHLSCRFGVSKVASSHLGQVIEFAQPPTSAKVDIDTCININLDHRPTFARGAWRVFLVIGKVHQFSKITTTQQ